MGILFYYIHGYTFYIGLSARVADYYLSGLKAQAIWALTPILCRSITWYGETYPDTWRTQAIRMVSQWAPQCIIQDVVKLPQMSGSESCSQNMWQKLVYHEKFCIHLLVKTTSNWVVAHPFDHDIWDLSENLKLKYWNLSHTLSKKKKKKFKCDPHVCKI